MSILFVLVHVLVYAGDGAVGSKLQMPSWWKYVSGE